VRTRPLRWWKLPPPARRRRRYGTLGAQLKACALWTGFGSLVTLILWGLRS
jgi:hypothetical protein